MVPVVDVGLTGFVFVPVDAVVPVGAVAPADAVVPAPPLPAELVIFVGVLVLPLVLVLVEMPVLPALSEIFLSS